MGVRYITIRMEERMVCRMSADVSSSDLRDLSSLCYTGKTHSVADTGGARNYFTEFAVVRLPTNAKDILIPRSIRHSYSSQAFAEQSNSEGNKGERDITF